MRVTSKTKICLVIGDPVEQSLSPLMHNAAFKAKGIDDQFIFLASRVRSRDINSIPNIMKISGIRGISLTIPHKIAIMKFLDKRFIDRVALKIGAVNTLLNDNGKIKGFNTDWLGVVTPLEKITSITGKRVAIIGAGGLARAAAFGLASKKAKLVIFNRTLKNSQKLAREFDGEAKPMNQLDKIREADIILNATPIGMHPDIDTTPLPREFIDKHHILFDAVYKPAETRLLKDAREKGARVISGLDLLLHQGVAQFELFTGRKAPIEIMRKALL